MNSKSHSSGTTNPRPVQDKLKTVAEIATIVRDCKAKGEVVVMAHGVFDLVHMGHIRHLQAARREGTILIVTTTADKHVHKGPGRPVFPQELRAEMLASIEYVDYVAINPMPDAVGLLAEIQPNVYVKGSEYENPEDDITGMISAEKDAVEAHGGTLVLTKGITFSSSALINNHLDIYEPGLRDYLGTVRDGGGLKNIQELIKKVEDFKVLMVGDVIIDEYQYVTPLGKSPKENMIATLFKGNELFAGGVIAAANHVADFCKEVEVISTLGRNNDYEQLVRDNLKSNVKLTVIYRDNAPTTRKTRFVESSYFRKLFEVYEMDDAALDEDIQHELNNAIALKTDKADITIVTDFGHGLLSSSTIEVLVDHSNFLAVNTQSNSANTGFNLISKYPRADYLCIDAPEARLAAADKHSDIRVIATSKIPEITDCSRFIITHGNSGCVSYDKKTGTKRIPAFTNTVVDTVGAGDAFFAITAPLVAAGGAMEDIGFIGNAAGAIKVGIVGHRQSVGKIPLMKYLTTLLK
ncbi:MAG: adenylyltransferase/cytidyltransferase family protein [Planctomycetes bacterium]|nr:adenylyltransferase/cytidyltransferase family protein [Planctomycetota bacterium]